MYFNEFGLLSEKQFINAEAQQRAVLLLHYLATGETEATEFLLVLQKILCGMGTEEPIISSVELSEKEKEESIKLLQTVTNYWAPLRNTSADGLRSTFIQREGKLSVTQNGWLLNVEQKAVDVLLGKLPWGLSTIRLPWMADIINVEWY
jgi:hypothetical protein